MKIHSDLIKFVLLVGIITNPFALAHSFMNTEEMVETFAGATLSGISSYGYSGARWTQVYEEFKEGKTEGTIKGYYAGQPYQSKWFIRKGKWCENWGTNNGCYDLERVDEKTIRAYEYGTPLENLWELQ